MKVALIINTHNEGRDLVRTVDSFKHAGGENVDLRFFIVADGTTDDSCDELSTRDDVIVLKPDERLGCGQAKHLAMTMAQREFEPDVIFHSDGHNRLIRGTIAEVAALCLERGPCIVTPAVGPLGCARARECSNHRTDKCTVNCPDIRDPAEPPGNSYHGGRMSINRSDHREVGLFVDNTITWPNDKIFQTQVVNPSCFAYSKATLAAIGGINRYPGWWGSQELGFSIRAWFAAVPILGMRADTCCVLHRYRSWNHPHGRAIAPYPIPAEHRDVNWRYCHRMVFDEDTWQDVWEPWFRRFHANDRADKMLDECPWLDEQLEAFAKVKKRTDEQFFAEVLGVPFPNEAIHQNASRSLYCVGAGLGNALMCVPAIKRLARITGQPVDVWDRGLHQAEGVAELFGMQPFVRKVILPHEQPDLRYYKYVVGSYWARGPMFARRGSVVLEANKGWRTRHEVECNLDALKKHASGITPSASLHTWKRADFGLPEDYVAIGVGCAGFVSKKWPHWESLAKRLHDHGVCLVFLGTLGDDAPWMDFYGVNLCGKTTIAQAAGVLDLARLYVGLDNGLSHLAAAVNCPSLLLYGPSSERKNRPWTDRCRVLRSRQCKHEPCWDRPQAKACEFEAEDQRPCMKSIRPEWVAGEVMKELRAPAWTHGDTWSLYLSRKQVLANMDAEPLQNHREFCELIDLLRDEQIVNVCEIGCADGGWLGILAGCLGRPLNILAIDPDPNSYPRPGECPANYPRRFQDVVGLLRRGGHEITHIAKRSNSDDALQAARAWVKKHGSLDLLHIDGDHSLKGCLADWDNYRGLVRPGGFVVFHDTANPDEPGVRQVFESIQVANEIGQAWELRCAHGSPKGRGIGVVRMEQ